MLKIIDYNLSVLRYNLDVSKTGVSYLPCIIHNILYDGLCDNNCPQNNLCQRIHLEVLK